MDDSPAVSVVIINYNKKDVLRQCLQSVLELEWPDLEIIVVDNVSTDGAAEMVATEFGDRVLLIRRQENSPTAARNQGFEAARGELILSLDNDMVFPDLGVIPRGVRLLQEFEDVGALAFKIGTVESPEEPLPEHWWYPVPLDEGKNQFFYTIFFSEGAVLFRAEALRVTGGYDEDFFQYGENLDLSLKMLHEGYKILFCPTLYCAELEVRGFLPPQRSRRNYLSLRNRLWVAWKHFPWTRAVRYALLRIGRACLSSLRYRWPDYFLAAVRDGIFAPRKIRQKRACLPPELWQLVSKTEQGMIVEPKNRG